MKGIAKKKNRYYWYVCYANGTFWSCPGVKNGFDRQADCARARRKAEAKIRAGDPLNNITLSDFYQLYKRDYLITLALSSQRNIRYRIEGHILPTYGPVNITEITAHKIQILQNKLYHHSPSVNRATLINLRALLNKAVEWNYLDKAPHIKILPYEKDEDEYIILTPGQLFDLVYSLEGRDKVIVALAGFAGLRRGEIFGLRWEDFDGERLTLRRQFVDGQLTYLKARKTKKQSKAVIPLWSGLTLILKAWKLQSKNTDWVFPGATANPLYSSGWMRIWNKIKADRCLPLTLRLHDLRHTFASILLSQDTNIENVRDLLRHKRLETTDIYRHLLPGQLEKVVTVWDKLKKKA